MSHIERKVSGFTIILHEHTGCGDYVILGARRTGPGSYEYVTGIMRNFDSDTEWFWGNYLTELLPAVENFHFRVKARE